MPEQIKYEIENNTKEFLAVSRRIHRFGGEEEWHLAPGQVLEADHVWSFTTARTQTLIRKGHVVYRELEIVEDLVEDLVEVETVEEPQVPEPEEKIEIPMYSIDKKRQELVELCNQAGIEPGSTSSKAELVELLDEHYVT